jgi:nicotinamide phosphoribosyltransferase
MSTPYDAAMSGAGHLLAFAGTDTVSAIDYVEDYYKANAENMLVGASVPATEHSVMSMGTKESEIETFRRLITDLYPSGIVSIVSDTWDFWKVISEYTVELKEEILNRVPNDLGMAKVVFRPDSGDPVKVITGYKLVEANPENYFDMINVSDAEAVYWEGRYYKFKAYDTGWDTDWDFEEISESEAKGAVETLWNIFGGAETDKGYRTLNERVGLIYGDSITRQRAVEILQRLAEKGFSADNIVFGVGSYTYQYNTRDTLGFAMKATFGIVDGEPREIFKDPITDNGTKKSAKGLLKVDKDVKGFYTLEDQVSFEEEKEGELLTVFKDGVLTLDEDFDTIRTRFEENL